MNSKIYRTRLVLVAVLLLIIPDAQSQLNFNPPRIVVSNTPLELMLIDGPPSKVAISGTGLEFVVNTDRDVFYESENEAWYLLDNGHWLRNSMLASGDWISTTDLPGDFLTLQINSDWPQVAAAMPARKADTPPLPLVISYEPTELVLIDGETKLEPIAGTSLQFVSNTSNELFLIDPALYQAGVAAAEGAVAEASAAVSRADKDAKRYRSLIKQQSVSQQQLDNAESELLQASAVLKTTEAQLLKAQIDLTHTVITAPFTGRIGRAAASVGDLVTPQTGELARLVELNPIYASFSISEGDVITAKRRFQAGTAAFEMDKIEVRLRLPDGSLYEHMGRVDFIDNVVDRRTGTIVLRARFDNPRDLLVPGLYVSTMLGREETTDKLVIPQSAVQEDQAGVFVMVVAPDSTVELRRIETGQAYAGELVVNSGLEAGEQVIVEGIQKVRPGLVVDAKIAPRPSMQQGDDAGSGDQAGER
jgi:membrane fusion protein (multidrug efflux system)